MKRGEIWWADLPDPVGTRPVLVLSRDEGIRVRLYVTVAPVTTRIRGIATEVPLGPDDGMPRPCVADLDSLQTVRKPLLRERAAVLSPEKMAAVERAIHFALDME